MLEKVCLDLLHDTRLLWAKPAKTPLDHSVKFHQDSEKRWWYCKLQKIGRKIVESHNNQTRYSFCNRTIKSISYYINNHSLWNILQSLREISSFYLYNNDLSLKKKSLVELWSISKRFFILKGLHIPNLLDYCIYWLMGHVALILECQPQDIVSFLNSPWSLSEPRSNIQCHEYIFRSWL